MHTAALGCSLPHTAKQPTSCPQHSRITATFALHLLPQNTPHDTGLFGWPFVTLGTRSPTNAAPATTTPCAVGQQALERSSDASNRDTQPCARDVTMCVRARWSVVSPADHHASRLRMCGLPPGARVCYAHWWAARTTSSATIYTVEACVLAKRRVHDGQPRCRAASVSCCPQNTC